MAVENEGEHATDQDKTYLTDVVDSPISDSGVDGNVGHATGFVKARHYVGPVEKDGRVGNSVESADRAGRGDGARQQQTSNGREHLTHSVGGQPWSPRQRTYRRVACLKGHSSRILHLDWTVDGRYVHTCGQDYQDLHWEILPPNSRPADGGGAGDGTNIGGELAGEEPEYRPRLFQRAFLLRDARWATWSTCIGWPVQVRGTHGAISR